MLATLSRPNPDRKSLVLSWAVYREGLLDAIEGVVNSGKVLKEVLGRINRDERLRG
jgi:hypothetical protein